MNADELTSIRRTLTAPQDDGTSDASDAMSASHGPAIPPVLLLGGEANALSVARDLGRLGVTVYGVGEANSFVRYSRYCNWIDLSPSGDLEQTWASFLLCEESDWLRGAVVLACSDAGIQVICRHRAALKQRFRLDESKIDAQQTMLDKLATYRRANDAGVATPRFWQAASLDEVRSLRDSLCYPLMIKPRLSHLFERRFGRKHLIVQRFDQLLAAFDRISDTGLDVLLMEWIPGGDDQLCSYYTYLDEQSRPMFHFTKRIIRRYPVGMGGACYHITDWIPELIDPANSLFRQVGLRGLANVEFKRDPRDGCYRLIECNARFTASNCLVSASGFNLARFVYTRITNKPQEQLMDYRRGLRLWDPMRDFAAFRELRAANQISWGQWLRSISHLQTFQYFEWADPMPAVGRLLRPLRQRLARRSVVSVKVTTEK